MDESLSLLGGGGSTSGPQKTGGRGEPGHVEIERNDAFLYVFRGKGEEIEVNIYCVLVQFRLGLNC